MKYFVLSFVLWFAITLPVSAESAEGRGMYEVVTMQGPINTRLHQLSQKKVKWEMCGTYFAIISWPEGKEVVFLFRERKGSSIEPMTVPLDVIRVAKKESGPPTFVLVKQPEQEPPAVLRVMLGPKEYVTSGSCLRPSVEI